MDYRKSSALLLSGKLLQELHRAVAPQWHKKMIETLQYGFMEDVLSFADEYPASIEMLIAALEVRTSMNHAEVAELLAIFMNGCGVVRERNWVDAGKGDKTVLAAHLVDTLGVVRASEMVLGVYHKMGSLSPTDWLLLIEQVRGNPDMPIDWHVLTLGEPEPVVS